MDRTRVGKLRDAFDPTCNFFTVTPVTINGKTIGPNQPFSKGLVEPRRLRQLYETRKLKQVSSENEIREIKERPKVEIGKAPGKATKIKAAKADKRNRAA